MSRWTTGFPIGRFGVLDGRRWVLQHGGLQFLLEESFLLGGDLLGGDLLGGDLLGDLPLGRDLSLVSELPLADLGTDLMLDPELDLDLDRWVDLLPLDVDLSLAGVMERPRGPLTGVTFLLVEFLLVLLTRSTLGLDTLLLLVVDLSLSPEDLLCLDMDLALES